MPQHPRAGRRPQPAPDAAPGHPRRAAWVLLVVVTLLIVALAALSTIGGA